jgi:hypothetical protein
METAIQAREEGIAQVSSANEEWLEQARAIIAALPVGFEGIGEDYRHIVEAQLPEPTSSGVWGALIRSVSGPKTGCIRNTGRMGSPKDTASHARKSWIYERV